MTPTRWHLLAFAALASSIDLLAKAAAVRWLTMPIDLPVLTVRVTHNSGMAFSLGADQPLVVVLAVTTLAVAGLFVAAWRGHLGGPLGAGLVLGGGVANVLDRMVGGSVVDLFDVGWWPVFNPADVFITVGVALVVFTTSRSTSCNGRDPQEAPECS